MSCPGHILVEGRISLSEYDPLVVNDLPFYTIYLSTKLYNVVFVEVALFGASRRPTGPKEIQDSAPRMKIIYETIIYITC